MNLLKWGLMTCIGKVLWQGHPQFCTISMHAPICIVIGCFWIQIKFITEDSNATHTIITTI